jgi:hypothetical protein
MDKIFGNTWQLTQYNLLVYTTPIQTTFTRVKCVCVLLLIISPFTVSTVGTRLRVPIDLQPRTIALVQCPQAIGKKIQINMECKIKLFLIICDKNMYACL